MKYLYIKNNKIIGKGIAQLLDDEIINLAVSDKIFDNFEKYIFKENKIVENPDYEAELAKIERERLNMLSLTKREVFLALYKAKGITPEQLKAQIADPEALIEFEYANEYYRGNPLIDLIGQKLGYTENELDYLFENGELPEKD